MLDRIESLRDDINKMIEDNWDKDELLEKSQELDIYISEFMKESLKKTIV